MPMYFSTEDLFDGPGNSNADELNNLPSTETNVVQTPGVSADVTAPEVVNVDDDDDDIVILSDTDTDDDDIQIINDTFRYRFNFNLHIPKAISKFLLKFSAPNQNQAVKMEKKPKIETKFEIPKTFICAICYLSLIDKPSFAKHVTEVHSNLKQEKANQDQSENVQNVAVSDNSTEETNNVEPLQNVENNAEVRAEVPSENANEGNAEVRAAAAAVVREDLDETNNAPPQNVENNAEVRAAAVVENQAADDVAADDPPENVQNNGADANR